MRSYFVWLSCLQMQLEVYNLKFILIFKEKAITLNFDNIEVSIHIIFISIDHVYKRITLFIRSNNRSYRKSKQQICQIIKENYKKIIIKSHIKIKST